MTTNHTCPNCGAVGLDIFYHIEQVPVHSVLLLATKEEAINYPTGDIRLGFCEACGFITNVDFDPALHEYSAKYEETQGFSGTFNAFHRKLAQRLIDQFDLRNKDLIEIGCGKGEFLTLLCELGPNRGVGFDPAFIEARNQSPAKDRLTFIADFYSEKYAHYKGDFVCCKMTLEHIPQTRQFVSMVRRAIGENLQTSVFFQVPDVLRVLKECAFWDIYYEHCSYFSIGSLARVFRQSGFNVTGLDRAYDDQYLMVEALPANGTPTLPLPKEDDLAQLKQAVTFFKEQYPIKWATLQRKLQEIKALNQRAIIWGAGSKGVAFLTTLNIRDEIEYAVDINPYKHNHFMAGTGQRIVSPAFLQEYQPHVIFVMNPIYCDEIRRDLEKLGLTADLIPVQ